MAIPGILNESNLFEVKEGLTDAQKANFAIQCANQTVSKTSGAYAGAFIRSIEDETLRMETQEKCVTIISSKMDPSSPEAYDALQSFLTNAIGLETLGMGS